MKKLLLTLLLSLLFLPLTAQDFEILSVESLPADMSAREEVKTDHDDRQCALLRVATQNIAPEQREAFTFKPDFGSEIVERATRNGEIWLWVSPGLKYLRIMHRDWGQYELRLPDYVDRVEALHTYKVTLKGTLSLASQEPEGNTTNQQYLVFHIVPKDAVLEVNGQLWPVSTDGVARKFVYFGNYQYRIMATDYHTEEGEVAVDNPNDRIMVNISLRPNFGWIEVKGKEVQDASVYVNNTFVGKAPCKSRALKSGEYTVTITKELYEPYIEKIAVRDDETSVITPVLTADYATVTLKVDANAEIWVNDQRKGSRSWTGPLGSGLYKIECRQALHETTVITKEITRAMNGQTISLTPPKPIYGSLNVESTPDFAKIFIDGEMRGETPKYFSEILIGTHEVKITKEGYADYKETVTVTKGERKQVSATLRNDVEISIHCNPKGALLTIDGQEYRNANGTYRLTYGSHRVEAMAEGYQDYVSNIDVDEDHLSFEIDMNQLIPTGIINGRFSVSSTKQVYFSKGNLQYIGNTNTWKFADHQWDVIGTSQGNSSQSTTRDLFGWGTSGYNHGANCYQPWSTSTSSGSYYVYGNSGYNLYDHTGQADWGYNAIANGGNTENNGWRTLTHAEWDYVFNTRRTSSGIRYAKAKVNNVNGVILLPDDWSASYYSLNNTNKSGARYSSNTIKASRWKKMEQHGAVFLPAAGRRDGTSVSGVGSYGYYWSASYYYTNGAWCVYFSGSGLNAEISNGRYNGQSVRLVRSA